MAASALVLAACGQVEAYTGVDSIAIEKGALVHEEPVTNSIGDPSGYCSKVAQGATALPKSVFKDGTGVTYYGFQKDELSLENKQCDDDEDGILWVPRGFAKPSPSSVPQP